MKIKPDIIQHEFIGLEAKVTDSTNPGYIGISGEVIDETYNTLTILNKTEKKIIIKDVAVIHLTMPDGKIVEIDGKVLLGRPQDRIKRRISKRW
jgi:ribonuclease P protein subunit POP4